MKERQVQILEAAIAVLKKYLNPPKIILFGSRAKGVNGKYADFDLAVDCSRPKISMQRQINTQIEQISGLYKVDIVYMRSVDTEFREVIRKTGRVVYERGD